MKNASEVIVAVNITLSLVNNKADSLQYMIHLWVKLLFIIKLFDCRTKTKLDARRQMLNNP